MAAPSHVLVIIGSVRRQRVSPFVAQWVAETARSVIPATSATFETVDLRDWHLPFDDEPDIPAHTKQYAQPHTAAWSKKVGEADGFIFVTPQYNWGYPAPLKNALDHIYSEWKAKAAMIVSYGGRGGNLASGQLRQVLTGLHMRVAELAPELKLPGESIGANTGHLDAEAAFSASDKSKIIEAVTELRAILAAKPREDKA